MNAAANLALAVLPWASGLLLYVWVVVAMGRFCGTNNLDEAEGSGRK